MARIDVNLNEVEIPSGEAHPDGLLHINVKKVETRKSNKEGSSGYPYLNLQLNPVGTENKRPVFLRLSMNPDALWNMKLFLEAIGLTTESDGSFDTDDLLGKECKVSCTATEYNGKPSNEIGPPYYKV